MSRFNRSHTYKPLTTTRMIDNIYLMFRLVMRDKDVTFYDLGRVTGLSYVDLTEKFKLRNLTVTDIAIISDYLGLTLEVTAHEGKEDER